MKKILIASLAFALIFTGCGAKEETKTEEEIRAEVKAELEAEMAAEAEEGEEANGNAEVVASDESLDLKDRDLLMSYIKETYPEAEYLEEIIVKYHDVNKDGREDAICYYDNYKFIGRPVILFDDGGTLKEIKNDMQFHYTQEIRFDDDFIYNIATYGGTGVSDTIKKINVYKDGQVVFTGATVLMEGYDSGPNVMNERKGEVTFLGEGGDYKHFNYREVQTGTSEYEIVGEYTYNPETYKFEINEFINTLEEENSNVNTNFPSELNGHKVLEAKQSGDEFYLKMDGVYEQVPGTISYSEYEGCPVFWVDYSYYENMESMSVSFDGETVEVTPPEGAINISENDFYNLPEMDIEKAIMKMDKMKYDMDLEIKAIANLSNYETGFQFRSEGGSAADIEIVALVKETVGSNDAAEPVSYDVSLAHLENETLMSEGEEMLIDYSKYSLVLIPTQTSKNMEGYNTRVIDVTSTGREQHYMLTVHGTLIAPKVTYRANGLDPDGQDIEIEIADTVENEIIIINAEMPTDTSSVGVSGLYQMGSGIDGPIGVGFDDARDPEFNKIVTVEGYSFPDEDY